MLWWKKKRNVDIGCRRPHFHHHIGVACSRLDLRLLLLGLHYHRGADLVVLFVVVVLVAGDDHWRKRRIVALDYWGLSLHQRRRAMRTVSVRHPQMHQYCY